MSVKNKTKQKHFPSLFYAHPDPIYLFIFLAQPHILKNFVFHT